MGTLWEPKIDTTTSIQFLCGFEIEIGDGYLPGALLREHPERLAGDRKVLDFASTTMTKDQNRRCWLVFNGRSWL